MNPKLASLVTAIALLCGSAAAQADLPPPFPPFTLTGKIDLTSLVAETGAKDMKIKPGDLQALAVVPAGDVRIIRYGFTPEECWVDADGYTICAEGIGAVEIGVTLRGCDQLGPVFSFPSRGIEGKSVDVWATVTVLRVKDDKKCATTEVPVVLSLGGPVPYAPEKNVRFHFAEYFHAATPAL